MAPMAACYQDAGIRGEAGTHEMIIDELEKTAINRVLRMHRVTLEVEDPAMTPVADNGD